MSYLVLARKYRPGTFEAVCGQEHVTKTLSNAIRRNKVAHAYIFAGPRGVGKTSIARIFAKALNCAKGPTPEPCLECSNCKEITAGVSLAVREIDGASHNSVDNVRELIESFRSLPPAGYHYKVYIIDEVHMLSTSAFNALLKSLEEPPPNTVFILATTELHKIPDTVISRCQKHELRALASEQIVSRLTEITRDEKIKIDEEAIRMIARVAGGSLRDGQSLLDRVQSFCEGAITAAEAAQALGMVEKRALFELSGAVLGGDPTAALEGISKVFSVGIDPTIFLREFAEHWRELLMVRFGGADAVKRLGLSADIADELREQSNLVTGPDLQDLVALAREGADRALRSLQPRHALEALLVSMATREPVEEIAAVLAGLKGVPTTAVTAQAVNRGAASAPSFKAAPAPKAALSPAPVKEIPAPIAAPASASRPTEKPVSAIVQAASAPAASTAMGGAPGFSWESFVKNVAAQGGTGTLFAEQLRRLSVITFSTGKLEVVGPEISIAYLETQENKKKLQEHLIRIHGGASWIVKLGRGASAGKPEPGSLKHSEDVAHEKKVEARKQSIREHPQVKNLLSAFPGSTVEE